MIMGLAGEKVKCIEIEDEMKRVEGHWSGFDIISDDSRNAFYSEKLSNITCKI